MKDTKQQNGVRHWIQVTQGVLSLILLALKIYEFLIHLHLI